VCGGRCCRHCSRARLAAAAAAAVCPAFRVIKAMWVQDRHAERRRNLASGDEAVAGCVELPPQRCTVPSAPARRSPLGATPGAAPLECCDARARPRPPRAPRAEASASDMRRLPGLPCELRAGFPGSTKNRLGRTAQGRVPAAGRGAHVP